MSAVPETSSYAIPDDQVAIRLVGHRLNPQTIARLRKRNLWPRNIYIASRSYVLVTDLERFIAEASQRAEAERAYRSERAQRGLRKRWHGTAAPAEGDAR
jgi:hypothetical protein